MDWGDLANKHDVNVPRQEQSYSSLFHVLTPNAPVPSRAVDLHGFTVRQTRVQKCTAGGTRPFAGCIQLFKHHIAEVGVQTIKQRSVKCC